MKIIKLIIKGIAWILNFPYGISGKGEK